MPFQPKAYVKVLEDKIKDDENWHGRNLLPGDILATKHYFQGGL